MPTVYSFHPKTGEFTDSGPALGSPKEPHVFLLPAHATFKAPPLVSAGSKAVWNGKSWDVVLSPDKIWLPPHLLYRVRA